MRTQANNLMAERGILLESGTNEVEVLVFRVGNFLLGINVAKVREILPAQSITALPQSSPAVLGCFRLREQVIPCVSLHRYLDQPEAVLEHCKLILTEFNHSQIAFVVDTVDRIHRISWEQISPVPAVVSEVRSPVTSVTQIDETLVSMLDFESIAAAISQQDLSARTVANPRGVPREQLKLLVADDSATVRYAIESTLRDSGYQNIECFEHGGQAWEWLQQRLRETGDARDVADLLISDVEMPIMDGLHLTQNLKQHPELGRIPVVLYSSILTPDNLKKGKAVGADAQVTKPEMQRVVELADQLCFAGDASPNDASPIAPLDVPTTGATASLV
jgi:two-component system chemotaxis response regulator CheV